VKGTRTLPRGEDDVSATTTSSRGLPYVAGLDGVRGLALVLVVLYHLEWSIVPGGMLAVSLFFTLSGYLITQLVLREFDHDGRVDLIGFWSRRLRRLMPASLFALAVLAVVSVTTSIFDGPRLRGDLWASLGYAANWRFASTGNSYEELFTSAASPVQHFWSLAIEEQLYVVLPLIFAGLLYLRRRRLLAVVLFGLALASLVIGLATDSRLAVYYGTHIRAFELLVGSLLALAMPIGRSIGRGSARVLASVSSLAAIVVLLAVGSVRTSDSIVYGGGLPIFSLLSALVILGTLVPGPVNAVMSWRPIVAIGKISYGAYVYHWPIFVAMTPERMNVDGWVLDVIRLVAAFAVAVVSFRVIEQPIRRRRVLSRSKIAVVSMVTSVVLVAVTIAFVPRSVPVALAGLDAPEQVVDFDTDPTMNESTGAGTGTPSLRISVLGSDTTLSVLLESHVSDDVEIVDRTAADCPLRLSGGTRAGCLPLDELLELDGDTDVLVIGFGAAERRLIEAMIGDPTDPRSAEFPGLLERRFTVPRGYAEQLASLIDSRPTLLLDRSPGDELGNRIADIGARRTTAAYVDPTQPSTVFEEFDLLVAGLEERDVRRRVTVIGDSVSYGVAESLNAVARDRYSVVWAGGRNCPIVEASEVRWWEGVEFDMTSCPSLDEWVPMVEGSDVVLVIVSVPEQSEQRYEPEGEWFVFDDDEFVSRHDVVVEGLVDAAVAADARLVFFSSPLVYGGALGGARFAQPDRVAGWNELMVGYAERWPTIELFDWASIVARYENEREGPGSLRGDGVHMDSVDLTAIVAAELLPFLDAVAD
jgi:peptidoglycan/LPS O-acetylase OafA/YrhL